MSLIIRLTVRHVSLNFTSDSGVPPTITIEFITDSKDSLIYFAPGASLCGDRFPSELVV